jgi:hypothetical protein
LKELPVNLLTAVLLAALVPTFALAAPPRTDVFDADKTSPEALAKVTTDAGFPCAVRR